MNKKQPYLIIITLLLFIVAVWFETHTKHVTDLSSFISDIESFHHAQEKEVDDFFKDSEFIQFQVFKGADDLEEDKNYNPYVAKLADKPYTINIFKGDSLVFWSNNQVESGKEELQTPATLRESKFVKLDNGYYEQIKQSYKDKNLENSFYTVIGLIPIKYKYGLTSDYLQEHFVADYAIPSSIEIQASPTDYPVMNRRGEVLLYMNANGPIRKISEMQLLLFLYMAAFFSFVILINSFAKTIAKQNKPWLGALFFGLSVLGLKMLSNTLNLSEKFSELPLFEPTVNSAFLGTSLGDLVINIVLLLWIMLFFHKDFPVRNFNNFSDVKASLIAVLNYFSVYMGFAVAIFLFKSLVMDTQIEFNFDNIFSLGYQGVLAIFSIILMLLSLMLFSHRMILMVHNMHIPLKKQYIALGVSALLAAPLLISWSPSLNLPSFWLITIASGYLILFHLFVNRPHPPFLWLFSWITIFSMLPAVMIVKYNSDKDIHDRITFAKDLSVLNDRKAEANILKLRSKILEDTIIRNALEAPRTWEFDENLINHQVKKYFSEDAYLFNNYGYSIHFFRKDNTNAFKKQDKTYEQLLSDVGTQYAVDYPEISYHSTKEGKLGYLWELDKYDDSKNFKLKMVLNRQVREYSKVYTELLVDNQFKNFVNLNKYNFAIYKDGDRFDFHGDQYGPEMDLKTTPTRGAHFHITDQQEGKDIIVYRGTDDIISMIGLQNTDNNFLENVISIFAYIFTLMTMIAFVMSLLNSVLGLFPKSFNLTISRNLSMRNTIQFSVIGVILSSFIAIAFVSFFFFSESSEDYHEARLERKTRAVMTDSKHEISILNINQDSTAALKKMVIAISEIHRMDLNLFDLDGRLISSSENDIYDKKIITSRMDTKAFRELSILDNNKFFDVEKVGALEYKSAYVPLLDANDNKLVYMGLPYYSKQRKQRTDVYAFMGDLMNVYVFLLLVAGAIAFWVSNRVTKPISQIEAKLKNIKLGGQNEPIEWQGQDELGRLIEEYNNMIVKLDDSAKLLAKSEREGAWREMAQQVTHEINNPLTPMKLNMQHMIYFIKRESDPDEIIKKVTDVSDTVIQQIDNLSKISREFANFVKMPRADNKKFIINYLVRKSFSLYKEDDTVNWQMDLPSKEYLVFGDSNHISRVLTNLLKNAKEAIPDSRKGEIKLELYQQSGKIVIKVTDNGEGIPDDKVEKVFVPNFTTKRSGTGLGLAISKSIINSIDGEIYFETELGIGTKFFIELPLVNSEYPKLEQEPVVS